VASVCQDSRSAFPSSFSGKVVIKRCLFAKRVVLEIKKGLG